MVVQHLGWRVSALATDWTGITRQTLTVAVCSRAAAFGEAVFQLKPLSGGTHGFGRTS
jgi:hypothetical protein